MRFFISSPSKYYSTVTDLAKFLGWSIDSPFIFATWYAINWRGIIEIIVDKISLLSLDGKQCFELGIKNNYVIVLSVNVQLLPFVL